MLARRSVLLLPLAAAACDEGASSARTFAPPSYSFLTPIRLNVATVEIDNGSAAGGDASLVQASPLRPGDGLRQMANDRLLAVGSAGRAVFIIDAASLQRVPGGGIEGMLAVHLDVFPGLGGERVGFAEARVARRRTSSNTDEDSRAVLYDFTTQMLNDMNVEFEFQIKRSLKDWLQADPGTAPPAAPVQTEALPPLRSSPPFRARPVTP